MILLVSFFGILILLIGFSPIKRIWNYCRIGDINYNNLYKIEFGTTPMQVIQYMGNPIKIESSDKFVRVLSYDPPCLADGSIEFHFNENKLVKKFDGVQNVFR